MVDPKPNLKPDTSNKKFFETLDRKWEQDENNLKKILDPIALDDSHDAWELRNSFLESVVDMKKETDGLKKKFYELGYQLNDIGMFKKENESLEESSMVSNFYSKEVLKDRVLKLLALNLSGITSNESLVFREKLFDLGTKISYLTESLKDCYEENEKARALYDKYLIEWAKINNVNIDDL
jgi:hypothetical protein